MTDKSKYSNITVDNKTYDIITKLQMKYEYEASEKKSEEGQNRRRGQ